MVVSDLEKESCALLSMQPPTSGYSRNRASLANRPIRDQSKYGEGMPNEMYDAHLK